jgi:hypothetical protein
MAAGLCFHLASIHAGLILFDHGEKQERETAGNNQAGISG